MKTPLLAILALFALSACGALDSAKVVPPGSGALAIGATLSNSQFQQQCRSLNGGMISSDGTMCLQAVSASIMAGQTGSQPIDNNFANGNYIVSTGSGADITLNGRHVSDVNSRMMLVAGSGQLAFNVTSATASGTARVYHCYDANMHYVYCNDGVIPH